MKSILINISKIKKKNVIKKISEFLIKKNNYNNKKQQ